MRLLSSVDVLLACQIASTSLDALTCFAVRNRSQLVDEQKRRATELAEAAQWVREVRELVDAERATRAQDLGNLVDRVDELATAAREEKSHRLEMSDVLGQVRQAIIVEQKDRSTIDAELASSLKDARGWVEKETQAREKANSALSMQLQSMRESQEEALREQSALDQRVSAALQQVIADHEELHGKHRLGQEEQSAMRDEGAQVRDGLAQLKDGIAKVADAVQQERRARKEEGTKLREDCREAVQKECSSRLERDSDFRKELESEGRRRAEAVELIEGAIAEVRHGLESHTHELNIEGTPRSEGAPEGGAPAEQHHVPHPGAPGASLPQVIPGLHPELQQAMQAAGSAGAARRPAAPAPAPMGRDPRRSSISPLMPGGGNAGAFA